MSCNCNNVKILYKKLYKDTQLPEKAKKNDACRDIFAYIQEGQIELKPSERKLVSAGFRMYIPENWEAQIRSRSGNTKNKGLVVANSPGTIDSDYTGIVGVILYNISDKVVEVKHGDRIAQMAIKRVPIVEEVVVDELPDTERGNNGYGSTGD